MKSESSNLDMLRTIAVLCVVLEHTLTIATPISKPNIQNLGRSGVLLFFVHTSLVLMMSLERQTAKIGTEFTWLRFMTRRVFRIYPLSVLAVACTVAFSLPATNISFHSVTVPQLSRVDVISNLFLTQNLTYSASSPGPLWSLPYEIQMYCALPFLFSLAIVAKRLRSMLLLWVGVLLLAIVYPFFPKTGRLTLLDFAPCFVPGVISYYMLRNGLRGKLNAILWPMFVLAVVACFYVLPLNVKWPQWIFCLVVGLAIPQFREIKNRHLAAVSHWVAKYSYGIYLAHVSCLWLTFIVCRGLPLWLQWTLIGPIIAASAFVLFHTVESPMIKLGARIAEIHLPKRETALPASA